MSIAIIFNQKEPGVWKKELESKIPNTVIEVYPNIKDKEKVDFILCWKPTAGIISDFPNIKVIQSVGASAEHIINSQTLNPSVVITRIVDESLSNDMFEFLLSVILFKIKNIDYHINNQSKKSWHQKKYQSIKNTSITILGLGEIGSHVATKFAELNFNVKGWSSSKKNIAGVKCFHSEHEYLEAVEESDFLVNLLPLTPDTKDILNFKTFSSLRKGATLINVGRGEHLVEEDLIKALSSEHLSGAVLDVFREEPLPESHSFWDNAKIIITPHIASLTNVSTASDIVVENYHRFLNKKELLHIVSHSKGY